MIKTFYVMKIVDKIDSYVGFDENSGIEFEADFDNAYHFPEPKNDVWENEDGSESIFNFVFCKVCANIEDIKNEKEGN